MPSTPASAAAPSNARCRPLQAEVRVRAATPLAHFSTTWSARASHPQGENDDADRGHGRLDWARLPESLTVGHNTHQRPGRGCAGALAKLLPAGRYLVVRL